MLYALTQKLRRVRASERATYDQAVLAALMTAGPQDAISIAAVTCLRVRDVLTSLRALETQTLISKAPPDPLRERFTLAQT